MPKGVYERSEEHRQKLSEAMRGEKNPMYGVCGEKSSMYGVRICGENHHFWGKHHSEETKRKLSEGETGDKHWHWKGGRKKNAAGYILIYSPNHPNKGVKNYVKEHRLVMEKHLGRYLTKEEVVHHIDRDKENNVIENLKLFESNGEHTKFEAGLRKELRLCLSGGEKKGGG